jgi:hypothetical protein
MFDHPALAEVDYYMRLDVDSFFLAPLPRDPLEELVSSRLQYGYLTTGKEARNSRMSQFQILNDNNNKLALLDHGEKRQEILEFRVFKFLKILIIINNTYNCNNNNNTSI